MNALASAQGLVITVLGLVALGAAVFAFVDAMRHDASAYASEGKQSKKFWLILLGVAALILFATGAQFLNIFGLIAIVAVGVYFADVRPAIRPYQQYKRRNSGGRGGNSGPYGSW